VTHIFSPSAPEKLHNLQSEPERPYSILLTINYILDTKHNTYSMYYLYTIHNVL